MKVELATLQENEKERFITEIQAAFKSGYVAEYGETDEEIIPREDVINSFAEEGAESYNILCDGEFAGGTVVKINSDTKINELLLLFIKVGNHSKGLGLAAWQAIEKLYPDTKIWETCTPYFEKRNLHFYINKLGFHAVEFYNPCHKMENPPEEIQGGDYFFRFAKFMKGEIL